MSIIQVDHVSKRFRLGQAPGLKQSLLKLGRRLAGGAEQSNVLHALGDVSFDIEAGEVVGIIGHNGAGKSTLLKLLAGISQPTEGRLHVAGTVAPLIEVGAGLVPDLTGRENIHLNATILGMSRKQVRDRFDEIVEFSELARFIDTPVKRYSSGMQVKLGFSIATAVDAEILIVDEVLAVGDLAFQRKCFDRMEDLIRRQNKTVLIVSHNLRHIERLCSRVMLLDRGRVIRDGAPREVCNVYYTQADERIAAFSKAAKESGAHHGRYESSGAMELLSIGFVDPDGQQADTVEHGSDVTVEIHLRALRPLVAPVFAVGVHTTDFLYLATENSSGRMQAPDLAPGEHKVRCTFRKLPISPGVYSLRMSVACGEIASEVFYGENLGHFQIVAEGVARSLSSGEGLVSLNGEWSLVCNVDSGEPRAAAAGL
ncbi:ABC transporter ATP-binding protein [Methyloversatilis sp.]|uniref:ABC transporter ATP-binding protein n=1 Tax=Methyloversatilis sp. TaxID=2569862 RepID=UPI0035B2F047